MFVVHIECDECGTAFRATDYCGIGNRYMAQNDALRAGWRLDEGRRWDAHICPGCRVKRADTTTAAEVIRD